MTLDVTRLRLLALTVPGVARLADHHGPHSAPRPATHSALRVFCDHVEIDIVLAPDHSVLDTITRLRAALADHLHGRALHITLDDVEQPN